MTSSASASGFLGLLGLISSSIVLVLAIVLEVASGLLNVLELLAAVLVGGVGLEDLVILGCTIVGNLCILSLQRAISIALHGIGLLCRNLFKGVLIHFLGNGSP